MKVVAFNGSPRIKGNTSLLIGHVFSQLKIHGIETKLIQLAGSNIKGCRACFKCGEKLDKKCALKNDPVNDYIAENYFNKPLWKDYYKIFQIVANEFEIVSEKYMMKYVLVVELENSIEDPNDERLIHMLTCELLGQKLTQYNGLNNPVVSFIKNHKNAN